MASDDTWNLQRLSPEAREAAREAARRRGVPVDQWMQAAILDSAKAGKDRPADGANRTSERWRPPEDSRRHNDAVTAVQSLNDRMDDIRGQLERLMRGSSDTAIAPSQMPGNQQSRELVDALQVIEDRLAGFSAERPAPAASERVASFAAERRTGSRAAPEASVWTHEESSDADALPAANDFERRVAAVDQALNSINHDAPLMNEPAKPEAREDFALGLDRAVEDIRERQRILDAAENADTLKRQFAGLSRRLTNGNLRPGGAPPAAASDVREQLRQITEELQSWRRSGGIQDALVVLREELSEIGSKLNEAAPRRALDALEGEVHAIAARLSDNRVNGADSPALASIAQGLADVRESLRKYAPAEALAAFRDEVRALDRKLEWVEANADGGSLGPLQQSVSELREVASHAASGDALIALAEEVQRISDKLDTITNPALGSEILSNLDRRFETLAAELGSRTDRHNTTQSEAADNLVSIVESLAAKLEHLELGHDSSVALDAVTTQLTRLTDRINSTDARLDHLEQMDRTFAELLDRVDGVHTEAVAAAERAAHDVAMRVMREASDVDGGALRHDLDVLRESHVRNERHTQDTLEVVHDTLEQLIDRLAAVETDMRAPLVPSAPGEPMRESIRAQVARRMTADPLAASLPPSPAADGPRRAPPVSVGPVSAAAERRPIDPSLPADHPLEPGAVRSSRPMSSAAERIAASEAALGPAKPAPELDARSNFIAAARRAAQAAANMSPPSETDAAPKSDQTTSPSLFRRLTGRRSLMLAAAILIAAGGVSMAFKTQSVDAKAMRAWALDHIERLASLAKPSMPAKVKTVERKPATIQSAALATPVAPAASGARAAEPRHDIEPTETASATPPPGPPKEPEAVLPPATARAVAAAAPAKERSHTSAAVSPFTIATIQQPAAADVTGSIGRATGLGSHPGAAAALPLTIAPPLAGLASAIPAGLQSAASGGNPAAAYEVASRYAEGRGVPPNMQAAAHWFEEAANRGLAPAQYRLGSLYEKGQGVKKDLDQARRLYKAAADKGNGKAMHNLAVLYSEGIDGKPDFSAAAEWFRKAADHGVADSQFNLGILYARGLGVEQSFVESYKWFALAAAHGDVDAGKKRDEIAARLGPQVTEAVQKTVQSFKVEPQPEAAINIDAPPGGWDSLVAPAPAGKAKVGHSPRRKFDAI
jgi:localization factor PodJL